MHPTLYLCRRRIFSSFFRSCASIAVARQAVARIPALQVSREFASSPIMASAGAKRSRGSGDEEPPAKKPRAAKSSHVGLEVQTAGEDSTRVSKERVMVVSKGLPEKTGPVVLWMSRDQRVRDNHALLYAADKAISAGQPLLVCFNLVNGFLGATIRQFGFMLRGLAVVERELTERGVPFVLLRGDAATNVPALVRGIGASAVVTDLTTVRIGREWRRAVGAALPPGVSFEVVDAHNIVPVWVASPKLEYAARTIRSKIHKQLGEWFVPVPPVFPDLASAADAVEAGGGGGGGGGGAASGGGSKDSLSASSSAADADSSAVPRGMDPADIRLDMGKSSSSSSSSPSSSPDRAEGLVGVGSDINWSKVAAPLEVDRSVREVAWAAPGEEGARLALEAFCGRLKGYSKHRNDPGREALSGLSPYFHFGSLSPLAANLAVRARRKTDPESADAFFEESVVRRELSDNYCFYNPRYDEIEGLYPQFDNNSWAQVSLRAHAGDARSQVYSYRQLDRGQTKDPLWNACQLEMVVTGKMHGFCRMLWAKKILEWTRSPQEAMDWALRLNDRYELDGRDPNGYVGVAWSVAGVHDQGWKEREVFGKIRYMSSDACRKKFDVDGYVRRVGAMVSRWRADGGRFEGEEGGDEGEGGGKKASGGGGSS